MGGGVKESDLSSLVQLASSTNANIDSSIGVYGVGLKRACFKLGRRAEILTRHEDEDTTHGILIPEEWLDSDTGWDSLTKLEGDELDAGVTEIRLEGLKFDFDEDRIRESIKRTYEYYLRGTDNGFLAQIYVNGTEVEPAEPIDWSYNPFGFHPRRYPEMKIDDDDFDLEEPVYVTITVGLLRSGGERAGTDIFCQGRKVLDADQGRKGGYIAGTLGNWSGSMQRFKLVLEFWTEGDNKDLPWNSTKSDINYSEVLQEAFNRAKKVSKAHRRIKYNIPEAFVKPYSASHEDSWGGGAVEEMKSYADRDTDRIRRGEKIDYSAIKRTVENIKSKAESHASLRFCCPDDVDDESHVTGYIQQAREEFSDVYDEPDTNITEVDFVPDHLSSQTYEQEMRRLENRAEEDAEDGVFDDENTEAWEMPYYEYCVRNEAADFESLERLSEADEDEIEAQSEEIDEDSGSAGSTEPLQSSSTHTDESSATSSTGGSETDTSTSLTGSTSTSSTTRTTGTTEEEIEPALDAETEPSGEPTSSTSTREGSTSVDVSAASASVTSDSPDETDTSDEEGQSTRSRTKSLPGQAGDSISLEVDVPSQLWAALCESVELPESADKSEVEEQLSEHLSDLIRLTTYDQE